MNVAALKIEPLAPQIDLAPIVAGEVRLLTCGSVDDGKSTLIGRLLWEAANLYDDQMSAISKARRVGEEGEALDFSLLVDGLQAEREQGITIDIAWRYFDVGERRFVIIDSPGHEQYTRNMATGASHADVAILLIDARHGVKRQTRRHAAICDLVGIKKVILAVAKMDLVRFSQARFDAIDADFRDIARLFSFEEVTTIPVAALQGHNVAARSAAMAWYDGPTLVEHLATLDPRGHDAESPFRFPVQLVIRSGADFRGYAGTVTAGRIRVGDAVVEPVSGLAAHVSRISAMGGDRDEAVSGDAVTLSLSVDLDISRGAVLSHCESPAVAANAVNARMVWLSERPFDAKSTYLFRSATDVVPVAALNIDALVDFETLSVSRADSCGMNDIADARITLGRSTGLDRFESYRGTGAFMLVDALDGATVAGGVITDATAGETLGRHAYVLTRQTLARGLCADLRDSPSDTAEFERRAHEVASLMRQAGVPVLIDL